MTKYKSFIPDLDQDLEPKHYILDVDAVIKNFSFMYEEDEKTHFICSCGNHIEKESVFEKTPDYFHHVNKTPLETCPSEDDDEYNEIFGTIQSSLIGTIECKECGKKTLPTSTSLIKMNTTFTSGFKFIENKDELVLYYSKLKVNKTLEDKDLNFTETYKSLKFTKLTKKLTSKDYSGIELEFDLDEIVKTVDWFFKAEIPIIVNIMDLHLFMGELSKHVSDSKSIDIVDELLSRLRGRANYAGLDEVKRIISIFFAIIKYSNLSTIALTKGPNFLYDLMVDCDVPKPNILRENNVTAPVKIFNFLITNYVNKLNEEVNEDNKEIHEFVYKSTKKRYESLKIKFKTNLTYDEGKVKKTETGKYEVLDSTKDQTISKFIYNKICNFREYRQLIKYLKFVSKNELIDLLKKYDVKFLTAAIDMVYFRDSMNYTEFNKLAILFISYAKEAYITSMPKLVYGVEGELQMKDEADEINRDNIEPDYNYMKSFQFSFYDDSIIMLEILKFDRKREFDRIKTFPHLKKFHNELAKFFSIATDEEKSGKFRRFVERFKFLESREDYKGPIHLKLISTPDMLMKEGIEMKHSGGSYSRRVINEEYVIVKVFDKSENKDEYEKWFKEKKMEPSTEDGELVRFTAGFNFNNLSGLEFDQVKGFTNEQGSDRFKTLLMDFLTEMDISYRGVRDLKLRG